jgi:hypothetical protein
MPPAMNRARFGSPSGSADEISSRTVFDSVRVEMWVYSK